MFCFVNFREHGIFITVIRYFYFLMSVNRANEFPPPPPCTPLKNWHNLRTITLNLV